jgi:rubrerythrin
MIKVVIDKTIVQSIYTAGKTEIKEQKTFNCPHCEEEITYFTYSPLSCPTCRYGVTDLDKLLKDQAYGRIAYHLGRYV